MSSVHNPKPCVKKFTKSIRLHGRPATINAVVRYDDTCGNGRNTFAITGEILVNGECVAGGCIHEEIAKHFPAVAPYIKWHLCSSDGPMHYVGNTVYLAGDRDHNGLRKGEPDLNPRLMRHFARFGSSPFQHEASPTLWAFISEQTDGHVFELERVADPAGKYHDQFRLKGMQPDSRFHAPSRTAYDCCPFQDERQGLNWVTALNSCVVNWTHEPGRIGEGKPRQLDAARRCAIWPEATDDELCADRQVLESMLRARLPQLLAEFEQAVTELGFVF